MFVCLRYWEPQILHMLSKHSAIELHPWTFKWVHRHALLGVLKSCVTDLSCVRTNLDMRWAVTQWGRPSSNIGCPSAFYRGTFKFFVWFCLFVFLLRQRLYFFPVLGIKSRPHTWKADVLPLSHSPQPFCFETRSHVAQALLEFLIPLPQPPKCWIDCRSVDFWCG